MDDHPARLRMEVVWTTPLDDLAESDSLAAAPFHR